MIDIVIHHCSENVEKYSQVDKGKKLSGCCELTNLAVALLRKGIINGAIRRPRLEIPAVASRARRRVAFPVPAILAKPRSLEVLWCCIDD